MSHKTKAAMQGRQCSTENKEQNQHTRPIAGGQSLSAPVITGTAPLAQFGFQIRTALQYVSQEGSDFKSRPLRVTKSHAHPQATQKMGCLGCTAIHQPPEKSRSFGRYPDIGYHSLAFFIFCDPLRVAHKLSQRYSVMGAIQPFGSIPCRRNSLRANSFIQLPRLTPSRSAASLSCWRNSGVIRIWKVGDSPSPFGVLSRLIVDMYVRNPLAWILLCTYVNTANIQKTTPRTVGAVPGRLTKPLDEVTIMAELQSTQTRPEFTWLFLATPKHYPECAPVVLRFDADTEACARDAFPGWNLVFAAKIRAQAPCRVSFFDYSTRRGWEFDSAAIQEVHHARVN